MGVPPVLRELHEQALSRWVPTWLRSFVDAVHGGFHERLDPALRPLPVGYKRLLTQCRQIFVYSQASLLTGEACYTTPLRAGFAFLRRCYYRPRLGMWIFSVDARGHALDATYDLYGHAFVVLALTFYIRATGDQAAHHLLGTTLQSLDTRFRAEVGFFECLSEDATPSIGPRRQNPHMHLFEACLMAYALTGAPVARRIADDVLDLFFRHFFDASTGTLVEFFRADWAPDPQRGHVVEPGHLYEWVWLLHLYTTTLHPTPSQMGRLRAAAEALARWAHRHVWDVEAGGIFDQVRRPDGGVLLESKRIWHVTEALKASCTQAGATPGGAARVARWLQTYVTPDGAWVETRRRDLTPATHFMPGTTPYHLLMGIGEAARLAGAGANERMSL